MRSRHERRVPLELKGIALVAVIGALIALSIASYNSVFDDVVRVSVALPRAGLQLNPNGDVRVHGALVGRIVSVHSAGQGATVELAINRDAVSAIPAESTAAVLPTTLFGQKYVELLTPSAGGSPVQDGDVLRAAPRDAVLEIGTVLDDLEPLLTAVRPEQLAIALGSVADGLQGRGNKLGLLFVDGHRVLRVLQADLPALNRDLPLFSTVMQTYAAAAPDLLTTLQAGSVTARSLVAMQGPLEQLLEQAAASSDQLTALLRDNYVALVALGRNSRPVLALFSRYSPEYPCLFRGLRVAQPATESAFSHGIFHVRIVLGPQVKGYTQADRIRFGDVGMGPSCAGLPYPKQPTPGFAAHDGVGGS